MNKKYVYILLMFVSFLSLLTGCRDKKMQINMTEITMKIGEVATLEVTNASGDVSYSSSDKNVATVNNGEITAVAAGSSIITVSDKDESLTCTVTVFDGAYVINIETDVVELIIGDEYQLQPSLLRGADSVDNVNFKFTSMDETIVTVENGIIKALKPGETNIQIDAVNYQNTSKLINVIVSNNFTIDLSEVNLTLCKMEILEYTSSKEISYVVKDNGNVLDINELSVSMDDENVVSVEKIDNKYLIKALNFGKAKISFSCQKEDGSEAISYINVEVVKPIIEFDKEYYFSTVNGVVDFSEYDLNQYNINLDANNCKKVYDNIGNDFEVLNTGEKTVSINSTKIAQDGEVREMYYDMDEFIINIDIVQCTLAIRTPEDFLSMKKLLIEKKCDDGLMHKRIDGYIALVNDLDFTDIEYVPFCGFEELNEFAGRSGFNAFFEGNNKLIKNIKLGSEAHPTWNSIFGNVGWDAEIRNLAIVDCSFGQGFAGAVVSDYFHGIASNIFISATLDTGVCENDYKELKTNGFSIITPYKYSTIEEVTIVIKNEFNESTNSNYVISGGPVYSSHQGTYSLVNNPIKSMVCIGGGDKSKLMYEFNLSLADNSKSEKEILGKVVTRYKTISAAKEQSIADVGSTSFDIVDEKLQVLFNGTIVYTE